MKNIFVFMLLLLVFTMCSEEAIQQTNCSEPATVRDLTGLDGCGWAFELNDGTKLEPYWEWGWCGTPPLPEGATEDPLYDFVFENGKTVFISYHEVESPSICMAGPVVKITCISDRMSTNNK